MQHEVFLPTRPSFVASVGSLTSRNLRISFRTIEVIITSIALPVILMFMFVELFGGAIHTGAKYVQYVVPGVLVLCAGYGASQTAVTVAQDMNNGMVDRLRSLDIGGAAFLCGHVLASVLRNIPTMLVVLATAYLLGFREHAGFASNAVAIAVLIVWIFAISMLSALLGMTAPTVEAANGYSMLAMFLPYASSAFVPVVTMPSWIRGFAGNQPVTPVVNVLRTTLLHNHSGNVAVPLTWAAGLIVASLALSMHAFSRKTAR